MEANYLAVAHDYAANVHALFASSAATGERSVSGARSPEALAEQAEKLAPISSSLTVVAEKELLAAPDAESRVQATTQLLAKALTDLKVSAHLLQAAFDEEENISSSGDDVAERSVADSGSVDELLEIVVGNAPKGVLAYERSAERPKDIAAARLVLSETIEDTLALISERTSKTGQAALTGLFGIGLQQVGQAAGLLGQNIAQALGQADKLSRLYRLVQNFAVNAYDSVLALLGPQVSAIAGQQVLNWIGEVKEAKFFGKLLEKMYQTKQTQQALCEMVSASGAGQPGFVAAIDGVERLGQVCSSQTDMVNKLLKGIKFLGAIPVAIIPYGGLVMAVIYIGICGYIVFNGADYVDAEQLKVFDRVPGVRQIVTANLTG